jgi:hypothetical protein
MTIATLLEKISVGLSEHLHNREWASSHAISKPSGSCSPAFNRHTITSCVQIHSCPNPEIKHWHAQVLQAPRHQFYSAVNACSSMIVDACEAQARHRWRSSNRKPFSTHHALRVSNAATLANSSRRCTRPKTGHRRSARPPAQTFDRLSRTPRAISRRPNHCPHRFASCIATKVHTHGQHRENRTGLVTHMGPQSLRPLTRGQQRPSLYSTTRASLAPSHTGDNAEDDTAAMLPPVM